MNKLSAVIITYNEEKNIKNCISSLQKVADEIIVLDSFSTDKTEEICRKAGTEFHQHKFDGYGAQKNRAVQLASHDWILSLDADEVLSEELIEEIKIFKQDKQPAENYRFNRLNFFCGKALRHVWQPDYKTRLWKKNTSEWTDKNLHETFVPNKNTTIKTLKGNLLHYSFESINQHIAQINLFSEIAAKELFDKNKKAGIKLFTSPITAFLKQYIFKGGFLDGYYGFIVAANSGFAKFAKYSKLKSLNKNVGKQNKQ